MAARKAKTTTVKKTTSKKLAKKPTRERSVKTSRSKELVAKKLRTGEIALWDPDTKSVTLISKPNKDLAVTARVISGASLKALNDVLGDVIVLV